MKTRLPKSTTFMEQCASKPKTAPHFAGAARAVTVTGGTGQSSPHPRVKVMEVMCAHRGQRVAMTEELWPVEVWPCGLLKYIFGKNSRSRFPSKSLNIPYTLPCEHSYCLEPCLIARPNQTEVRCLRCNQLYPLSLAVRNAVLERRVMQRFVEERRSIVVTCNACQHPAPFLRLRNYFGDQIKACIVKEEKWLGEETQFAEDKMLQSSVSPEELG
ncbi:hypothetical protein TSMEX_005530 [Taenia solium]|eukprot:TsM_001045100 transcript=TsM_001045100 gene=TsM_001045100